ncbi:hypothetical protein PIB30_056944 [Stylosanthes scabra]|uniref:Uncharacterized protein n=1 Tax=Stylosanthes scabra TaxID=79078 RepID=A0ABU6UJ06_9FABA|nr:hypothetical protein [Stylosanthes scabra]
MAAPVKGGRRQPPVATPTPAARRDSITSHCCPALLLAPCRASTSLLPRVVTSCHCQPSSPTIVTPAPSPNSFYWCCACVGVVA